MHPSSPPPGPAAPPHRIPVLREEVEVVVGSSVTGTVRVRVQPRLHEQTVALETVRTEVEIQRVPIGREVDAALPPRQEGDEWVVPVYAETLVVQRRLVLQEELRLRLRRDVEPGQAVVALRRDEVHVERLDADGRWVSAEAGAGTPAAPPAGHADDGEPAAPRTPTPDPGDPHDPDSGRRV